MRKTYIAPETELTHARVELTICQKSEDHGQGPQLGKKRGSEPEEESASGSGIW